MLARATLTGVWIVSFLVTLIIVESYIGKSVNFQGRDVIVLLEEARLEVMRPVFFIYGAYLTGILGFWFLKPFPALVIDKAETARFWIALVCTMSFNVWIIYMFGKAHFSDTSMVLSNMEDAVWLAKWISIIVAPVNAYYFGMNKDN